MVISFKKPHEKMMSASLLMASIILSSLKDQWTGPVTSGKRPKTPENADAPIEAENADTSGDTGDANDSIHGLRWPPGRSHLN